MFMTISCLGGTKNKIKTKLFLVSSHLDGPLAVDAQCVHNPQDRLAVVPQV